MKLRYLVPLAVHVVLTVIIGFQTGAGIGV
jgi:hypothetical protein